jgi:proteasome assembly chaperone (PAC2) family protein
VKYDEGVVQQFKMPANEFWADEESNLVFFIGKEPNLKWREFGECIFSLAKRVGVSRIIFMGSFGGSVPHTREPRLYGSVSSPALRELLKKHRLRPTEYEGPGSFATFLLTEATRHGMEMLSLVAEIPSYLQGRNPMSIEAISRRLAAILGQPIDVASLREFGTEWETQVSEIVEKDEELAATIRKMEDEYDSDLVSFQQEES